MVKVLKNNCENLKFEVCKNCNSLLQFKESDISSSFGNNGIITGIKCPHCSKIVKIKL